MPDSSSSERSVCETDHKTTVKRTPVEQVRVTSKRPPRGRGGVLLEKLGGGVRPAPKTLTLFMTKICDIPYPNYFLTFKSKPCF